MSESGSACAEKNTTSSADLHESVFVSEEAPVYDVPMRVIHRPLQSFTDEQKVRACLLEPVILRIS